MPLSDEGRKEIGTALEQDEDKVLLAIAENGRASFADHARTFGWALKDCTPNKMRVSRAAKALKAHGLIKQFRSVWRLTSEGEGSSSILLRGRNVTPALYRGDLVTVGALGCKVWQYNHHGS